MSVSLPDCLGVADDRRTGSEYWFLKQLEKGLYLLGRPVTEQQVWALYITIPDGVDPTQPSMESVSATQSAVHQIADILGGVEAVKAWNDLAVWAFKAAFDHDIREAKQFENSTLGKEFERASQKIGVASGAKAAANLWVYQYNDLDSWCRRPALIAPLQNWIKHYGMRDVRSAQGGGCAVTLVALGLLAALCTVL